MRVTHLQQVGGFLNTYITVIGNLGILVAASFLGGDDYNTVGGAYTVDGRCGCVFQDGHVLNVGIVQEVDVVVEHSVHYIERRSVTERTHTADGHFRTVARCSRIDDVDTRYLSLQCCHRGGGGNIDEFFFFNDINRGCQVFCLGRAVTDNHDFFQQLCVFM